MTVQTIIEQVLEELERPDLEAICKARVSQSVRAAHSARKFAKDLREVTLVDPDVTEDNRVRFIVSEDIPRLREPIEIQMYAGYTEIGDEEYSVFNEILTKNRDGFLNRIIVGTTDYYGFKYPHLYSKVGNELVLNGVDKQTKAIWMRILSWPEIELDDVTQEISTDSWIVDEWPEVIKSYLRRDLAMFVQKSEFTKVTENLLTSARMDMINSEDEAFF